MKNKRRNYICLFVLVVMLLSLKADSSKLTIISPPGGTIQGFMQNLEYYTAREFQSQKTYSSYEISYRSFVRAFV